MHSTLRSVSIAFALASATLVAQTSPVVPGGLHDGLAPKLRGLVLLGELGCTACHAPAGFTDHVERRAAPDLAGLGARMRPEAIAAFVEDPRAVKPGTTMPHALAGVSAGERADVAAAITHFLVARSGERFDWQPLDTAAAGRGQTLFHDIGCAACHAPRTAAGEEIARRGAVPLGRPADRWSRNALFEFLRAPHHARPSRRMPNFDLEPGEAFDLANFLMSHPEAPGPNDPNRVWGDDPATVAEGARHFEQHGCAQCHVADSEPQGAALDAVDPTRGCLADDPSNTVPDYALSAQQRADIRAALGAEDLVPDAKQHAAMRLAAFNCYACHERDGVGGVTAERADFFTGHDGNLGSAGRVPPPLTGVGAKLQTEWLADAIAVGQKVRPYLKTRMPGFGVAHGARLAELLTRADPVPPHQFAPLPEPRKEREAIRNLGRQLVGIDGMACITCHTFRGQRSATMAAVDIAESTTQRLRREWFRTYMLNPAGYRSDTLMPSFFPSGKSIRADLVDGDAERQLDAIWYYLTEGRNAREPKGLKREPIEVVVGDEAVVLRRAAQNTGKRAISVGYPLGVNVTFDAESLALNQVWWGKFVDASPVWTGQGSGQVRILGKPRLQLGKGPAFATLTDARTPWPDKTRRDLDHRFLGYRLGDRQRPTFRYECEGVAIADSLVDRPLSSTPHALLERTLTFTAAEDKTLWFRAAVHPDAESVDDQRVRIGRDVHLGFMPGEHHVRKVGDTFEVLVPVRIRDGRAELQIHYRCDHRAK